MMQGAIFDVDGTLLDSMFIWSDIGEVYLRSIGYTPKENLAETFKTFSLYQSACYYQTEYGVKLSTDEIMDGMSGMIEHFYRDQVQLKPGVEFFLRNLQSHDIKMCIATATDDYLVDAALRRCGIRDCFSEIFTCTGVKHSKNEPDIFRAARNHLATTKAQTFVFEDAFHAAKTAKNDGFPVVAVYDPSERQQTELTAIADFSLNCYSDFDSFWKFASK